MKPSIKIYFRILLIIAISGLQNVACISKKKQTFVYKNPIYSDIEEGIRDPQILKVDDVYYLVGTCAPFFKGKSPGIKLCRSTDLINWSFAQLIIDAERLAPDVWYKNRFWAPEIHVINGKYYLTFNCYNKKTDHPQSCGLAVANDVLGPYTVVTHETPLVTKANDLTIFNDDGRHFVYYNRHKRICGQEIDMDRYELLGEEFVCFRADSAGWEDIGIEGPWVMKRADTYYMFYSSWTRGYEIGYATASDPRGPWKKYSGNPFFGAQNPSKCKDRGLEYTDDPDSPYIAVGHNSIFTGPDGRDWIVCHYIEKGKYPALGFDPMWIEEGVIHTTGPTYSTQTINY